MSNWPRVLLFSLGLLTSRVGAQSAAPHHTDLPLLVLAAPNAYGKGWDGPELVILPSGWLIWRNPTWENWASPYLADSLGPRGVSSLLDSLGITDSLLALDSLYEPPQAAAESSHPPFHILFLRNGPRHRTLAVRGELPAEPGPAGLYALLRRLMNLAPLHASPYRGLNVEITVGPSYGPAATSDWPTWLPHPASKQLPAIGPDMFRGRFGAEILHHLKELADTTSSRPVVMALRDRLWLITAVRYPFPGDSLWYPWRQWAPE